MIWSRDDGQPMPLDYRIENFNLVLPHVQPSAAGKYKCLVEELTGRGFVSMIELRVADHIPMFDGRRVVQLLNGSAEKFTQSETNLRLELVLKPAVANGSNILY